MILKACAYDPGERYATAQEMRSALARAGCADTEEAEETLPPEPEIAAKADGIPIDEAHFPDDNFRAYILSDIDADGDGYLSSAYAYEGDGKHFEKSGYVAWANYMKTHYVDSALVTE